MAGVLLKRLQHEASQLCAACAHMRTLTPGHVHKVNRVGRLVCAGGDCDLVTPQSTVKGKGYWGEVEGLEVQLHLNASGDDFVNNPLNFRRVQVRASTQISAKQYICRCSMLSGVAHSSLVGIAWDAHVTAGFKHETVRVWLTEQV